MKMRKKAKYLFIFLLLINVIVWILYFSGLKKDFSINFFDIGNGDGMLIETPEHFRVVADGGSSDRILDKIGLVDPFLGKDIDLLILTHPHEDHVFSALEVIKNFRVKSVLSTGVIYTSPTYLEFLKEIEDRQIHFIEASQGQVYQYGELSIEVIYPFSNIAGEKFSNVNDSSLVFRASFGNFSAIFLGDIEEKAGLEILKQGVDISANVVKISHQGARNGAQNLPFFLERINPQAAIVSVGENHFGHPAAETAKRLDELDINFYRTDLHGTVTIFSDKEKFWIKTSVDKKDNDSQIKHITILFFKLNLIQEHCRLHRR